MSVKHVSDNSFQQDVLKADGSVLVDFWAEWCGPCRNLSPILDQLAEELGGKVTIAKVNIDESPEAPSTYGVRGIPTMILFKNGQAVATKVGALPKTQLKEWLESHI
ncbi:MAG: thioredoxin TrxA [Alphaproteobacteria bacterium]|nr:MAG: thioredoxin TrxA [Alphaproteobacteria bacterium]TAF16078.1 MAG: thioredoxin TrxA [Alphaproteobacteria bacterium]TAF40177.1 MAG: thioredoxin TrxA [Alphaproteobacteria bacterium]TAF75914.1 MAG: thioredoxin TrxA [Alphaproteobacteria bacterium]